MISRRPYNLNIFRGAWPAGTYQLMMEFTGMSSGWYHEARGIHVNNGVLAFSTNRHDS